MVRHSALPPLPYPRNLHLTAGALGWLAHSSLPTCSASRDIYCPGPFRAGHSGEESLAQVYREIEARN